MPDDWEEEKARLGALSAEEWRERREEKEATTMEAVDTWKSYFVKHLLKRPEPEDGDRPKEVPEEAGEAAAAAANTSSSSTDDEAKEKEKGPGVDLSEKVSIFKGDITSLGIDVIVNAANEELRGGGGVDGAIHRAAGRLLLDECITLDGCPTGEAKMTCGYKLPAKYVIHTVGPMGEKPELLESCYEKCLNLMLEHKLRSIAFPCISTGVYGYSSEKACPVALETVKGFLSKNHENVDRVIFCLFLKKDIAIYEREMQKYFSVKEAADEPTVD